MVGWAMPQPFPSGDFHFRTSNGCLKTNHLIAAAALRFTHFLHHRFINHRHNIGIFFGSSFKNISLLGPVAQLKDLWHQRGLQFQGFNLLQWSNQPLNSSCWSCLYFPSGEENENYSKETRKSYSDTSRRISFNGRHWTNVLLAINVLVYVAQLASQGKLLLWGAKINSLIDRGQLWRLATSSFMHANIVHLLVGSFAIFVLRHRHMVKGAEKDLQHITHVILMNMVIGLISKGIDNWGHLGGLIGGVASSWLLGPLWRYEYVSSDGRRGFTDRAPILSLVKRSKTSR